MGSGNFYEDDEPVEKIGEAFARGRKVVTRKREKWALPRVSVTEESLTFHMPSSRADSE